MIIINQYLELHIFLVDVFFGMILRIHIYIYWGVSQSFKGNPHQATRRDDTGFWRLPSCDCGGVRRPTPVDWWLVRGSMMMHGGWSGWSIKYIAISMDMTVALFLHVWMCVFCLCFFLLSSIDEWWSKKNCTNSDKWIVMSTSSNYNHYTYTYIIQANISVKILHYSDAYLMFAYGEW